MNMNDLSPSAALAAVRPTVLVVDDTPTNLSLLSELLGPHYRVQLAVSGAKALELAQRRAPDLIVLDVMMPGMDGHQVCRRLKADACTRDVPVLFLTALNSPADENLCFEVGGADFVAKPFNPATLMARVRTQLDVSAWRKAMRDRNAWLQSELALRVDEVEQLRDTTLFVMVGLAEFRDSDTGQHVRRTQEYVRVLARWISQQGGGLDDAQIDAMARAAPLHDIGKVAIPDRVLLKPGPLTAEEWGVMKTHADVGADLLQRAADRLGDRAGPLLRYGIEIARHHHEKWDGSGYPAGLAGEAIPLSARLMAVADVYDALISRRVYKEPMGHDVALGRIAADSGKHFDPLVVRALFEVQASLTDIAQRFQD
ncbi:MAG: two-component system response regulator [Pseudomonadota bacterium]|nr:two-component system response regulator [Pseudomonadota bacterium]